jgi:hypothetical protein
MLLQLKLMTSWAVVCDVYFLPPQTRADGETAQQFAERCQVPHPAQRCRCCCGCRCAQRLSERCTQNSGSARHKPEPHC